MTKLESLFVLLLLLISTLNFAKGSLIQHDPAYFVIAPTHISSHAHFKITLTLLQPESMTLRASINWQEFKVREYITGGSVNVKGRSSKSLVIQVPDITKGFYTLKLEGFSKPDKTGLIFSNETQLLYQPQDINLLIQLNKPFFKMGQKVRFRVVPLDSTGKGISTNMDIQILDPRGYLMKEWISQHTNAGGVLSLMYQLTYERCDYSLPFTIRVKCQGVTAEKQFTVQNERMPFATINITLPDYILTSYTGLRGTVKTYWSSVLHTFRGNVTLNLQFLSLTGSLLSQYTPITREIPQCIEICDFVFGMEEMVSKVGSRENLVNMELRVSGQAWENEYVFVKFGGANSVYVYENELQLEWVTGNVITFKPGSPLKIQIAGSMPDGSPIIPYYRHRKVYLEITTVNTNNRSTTVETTTQLQTNSIAQYWLYPVEATQQINVVAKWNNSEDSKISMIASRYWSPNRHYLYLSTSTKKPSIGQFIVLNIKSNVYVDNLHYYINGRAGVISSDKIQLDGKTKIFSIAASDKMLGSCTIVAFYIDADGFVISDSLNIHVQPDPSQQLAVRFNAGKDLSYNTVEVTVTGEPGSYVSLSATDHELYQFGVRSGSITWDIIMENLYDKIQFNTSAKYYWKRNHVIEDSYYATSLPYAHDANSTFYYSGLYMFTDANVSSVYTSCNKTEGKFPCMNGVCYTRSDMCDGYSACHIDSKDEMGCNWQRVCDRKKTALMRKKRTARLWDDNSFGWVDNFIKPNGRVDMRIAVPSYPTDWVVSAFSMSEDNGINIAENQILNTVKPLSMYLWSVGSARRGEHIGISVIIHNNYQDDFDVLVTVAGSPHYSYIEILRDEANHVNILEPGVPHQVLLPIMGNSYRKIQLPIRANRVGTLIIPIKAECFLGEVTKNFKTKIKYEGVPQTYITNLQYDLRYSTAQAGYDWLINANENQLNQDDNIANYISESPQTTIYLQAGEIGTTFPDGSNFDLDSKKTLGGLPDGSTMELLYNIAANTNIQRVWIRFGEVSFANKEKMAHGLGTQLQQLMKYLSADGGFRAFDYSSTSSVWLTSEALVVLSSLTDHASLLEPLLAVPTKSISVSALWLTRHQLSDGSFSEISPIYNRWFKSNFDVDSDAGSHSSNLAITAICNIAHQKAQSHVTGNTSVIVRQSMALSTRYLEEHWYRIIDPFELSIVTYALTLANRPSASSALDRLYAMRRNMYDMIYWATKDIAPQQIQTGLDGRQVLYVIQYSDVMAYSVATTSYTALSYLLTNDISSKDILRRAQRFLAIQRLYPGGSISSVDSLLALRVLTQIAELNLDQTSYDITFNITASADPNFRKVVRFDKNSWLKLMKLKVPSHWGKVIPDIRGTGIGLMQMVTTVNYEHEFQLIPAPNRTFDLGDLRRGITTFGFNHTQITFKICPKWIGPGERSGLAVVQIDFPTGYGRPNATYVNYVKKNMKTSSLKYARASSGTGQFFFEYFDNTTDTHCVNFTVERKRQIANISEHHYIRVYEYYEPMNYNQSIYELVQLRQLTVCLVCGSYQCPYCPNYAGTSQIRPNNYLTIITLLLMTFTKHFWDSIPFK